MGGTREEADGLVSKCLLQDVGEGRYRVHDLVLQFVKIKIKADVEMMENASFQQAQYLSRLNVLKRYQDPDHDAGSQGLFVLDALWRSVENLSRNSQLEVDSYHTSLRELETCEAMADVANCYHCVGSLFRIQARQILLVHDDVPKIDNYCVGRHVVIFSLVDRHLAISRSSLSWASTSR